MEEKTRCFICVEFPENVVKEIARVQSVLMKKKFQGKLTEVENLHLTLKFLGEIDDDKLNRVESLLRNIEFNEMDLKLGQIGIFSHKGRPRIVWIKVEGDAIWNLQRRIDLVLSEDFKKEERFMSHLTVARIKYVRDWQDFNYYVENIGIKSVSFKTNKFKLKKSELKPLGPSYSTIEEYSSENAKI